ncbi:hypothetical protein [Salinibacterium sp. PAMC 21357]|uniref:hypothetical protein n=1 Tax=Salinibacterium sp. PAMC 21357 TaxID=1112215 RepID=UPI00028992B9|nr:hypothetical protein [Salinibacterium sp. PAMC 21357]
MTQGAEVFYLAVSDAVEAFSEALIALIKPAQKVGLVWQAENTHDDWESLAESAFEVLVSNAVNQDIRNTQETYPLARYDFDLQTYAGLSWLEVDSDTESEYALVLVRFSTTTEPFDTPECTLVRIATGERMPSETSEHVKPPRGTTFRLRRRSAVADDVVRVLQVNY